MFKCNWCEEEYDDSVKFYVVLVDVRNIIEKGFCCPDCIAVWFTDDAENLISVNIMKVEEDKKETMQEILKRLNPQVEKELKQANKGGMRDLLKKLKEE